MQLTEAMELDFRAMLATLGIDAIYVPRGTKLELPVRVLISAQPAMPEQRVDASPRTAFITRGTNVEIEAPSMMTGENNEDPYVGDRGGVVVLREGDSFTVDGRHVNRAEGPVTIKIGSRIERFPGRWVGGGAL